MKNFIVGRRSKPVIRISSEDDEEMWERVVDFTEIKKGGLPVITVLSCLQKLNEREFR